MMIVKNANQWRSPNAAFDPSKGESGFLLGACAADSRGAAVLWQPTPGANRNSNRPC
jgi:hypothetical protein